MSTKTPKELRSYFSIVPSWTAWVVISTIGESEGEAAWGPFDNENAASQCVHVLAARPDISSAVIVWLPPDDE